jgi:hypothetical protein
MNAKHKNFINMKILYCLIFVIFTSTINAQSVVDSADSQPITDIYDQHCALVENGFWRTTTGVTKLRWNGSNIAKEFEISPDGAATRKLSQRQFKQGFGFIAASLGLSFGSMAVLVSGSNNYSYSSSNRLKTPLIAAGMLIGSVICLGGAVRSFSKSSSTLDLALWQRNRDAMLANITSEIRPQFKQVYERETIFLGNNHYIKNGRKTRIRIWGNGIKAEFEDSPLSQDIFKRFQQKSRIGSAAYYIGAATMLGVMLTNNSNYSFRSKTGRQLYMTGAVTTFISGAVLSAAVQDLRRAIHIRNREVIEQRMAFRL